MPDNNGVSNKDVEPIISVLQPIQEDVARDTKSGEDMNVQLEYTNKREGSELSTSQDSITAEGTARMGTIILTTEPEDSVSQTKLHPANREGNPPEMWQPPRPTAALVREPSVQSDAGSHCSSVESLLGSRRADPEQILLGLGFGGTSNDCESDVSRIPRRFLQPSKVKGVIIDDFLKHQQYLVHNFESGFYGYRGLTGTGHRPSVIVAKIMEKLRGGSCGSASPPPSPAGKRFSKAARKVMNVLPSSVLTPDNRRFLDDQGGKSPEVPRKRMIIGQRSFTFDRDGQMIELRTTTNNISISSNESNKNPAKDHVLSPSLSLSSSERDNDNQSNTQNLTNDRRSLSLDSSEAPPAHSTPIANLTEILQTEPSDLDFPSFKPAFSVSSRSASMDSTDSPSLSHHPPQSNSEVHWDIPLSQRRNRFSSTSLSSWESMSPKGDFERPFPRYESIEETSERGDLSSEPSVSTTNEEVRTPLQIRRGSLKRQQHVEEDVQTNPEIIAHILEECEVFTSSSHDTLSQPCEDSVSMTSSLMEHLLNPDKIKQNQEKDYVSDESVQVPSSEAEVENTSQPDPESSHHVETDDAMQMRVVSTLMRARSDSSGFLDLEGDGPSGDERNAMATVEQNRRELDELVQELKERGVTTGNCRDTAVRLALTSYGDQLKSETDAKIALPDARYDLETLCQLRETVAAELRRVADLLDEQPSATGIPIVTTQMTALLREQTKLRRQLEALNCESPPSLDNVPSCCNMLSLVRDEHRHLESLVEQNSRELANIRQLLHELLATQR